MDNSLSALLVRNCVMDRCVQQFLFESYALSLRCNFLRTNNHLDKQCVTDVYFLSFRVKILLILRVCHEKLTLNLLLVKELFF